MDIQFKFRNLVNRHQRLVYAIALRILGNPAEAEDAAQEVYERVWKHIESIKEEEAKQWLSKVTRNVCIDRLRAKKPSDQLELADELPCGKPLPSEALDHLRLSDWLREAIGKLQEPYRSLITLLELQEKSIREAAAVTQLSENQVKVYNHRAKKQLRALLQGKEL